MEDRPNLANLLVQSFFPEKGNPIQILFRNGDTLDVRLENLIPLYTKAQVKDYWMKSLFQKGITLKTVNQDIGTNNDELSFYFITEHG